jgi:hypothetical protein
LKGSGGRSSRLISYSTLYVIQCLLGSGSREWTLSPSCGLPDTAASSFRSDIFIRPRRQWSGLSSAYNCPAIPSKSGQSDSTRYSIRYTQRVGRRKSLKGL